jgi:hypothetical protein
MRGTSSLSAVAAFCCLVAHPALAAAPDVIDAPRAEPRMGLAAIAGIGPYRLDTEMTVHNWALCISADVATSLVKARGEGKARGDAVYADLRAKKACGIFPELQVILQQRVLDSPSDEIGQAQIFGALVKFSGQWARAFVVSAEE